MFVKSSVMLFGVTQGIKHGIMLKIMLAYRYDAPNYAD